jgi:S1-C subfamily serine protease
LLVGLLGFISVKGPELHYNYIRSSTQAKTVMITNQEGNSGGTGVHIITPKGNKYILTNAHVCEVKDKDGFVYVQNVFSDRLIPRKVIEMADFTDLCLVEPLPGADYISMGSEPTPGQIVAVVGHPRLYPTTMSRGEIIGNMNVDVLDHIIDAKDPNDTCSLPKNKKGVVNWLFFQIPVCLISIEAVQTNVVILGGNSGSPVVNFYGNLVGIAFASDDDAHWGIFIKFDDIVKFIAPY